MLRTIMLLVLLPTGWCGAEFTLETVGPGRSLLRELGRPVLVYNHGEQLAVDVPQDRTRSCYVHPLFGLDGEVLTDDFPHDHLHHRGVAMMWPRVRIGDQSVDQWHLAGIRTRNEGLDLQADGATAVLTATNIWTLTDGTVAARETTVWRVHPSDAEGQAIDVESTITAGSRPVTLRGAASPKGYGGHVIRLAPRTDGRITTDRGAIDADCDRRPFRWADYSGTFDDAAGPSGITMMPAPSGPDYPPAWQLRPYGVLGIAWPGLASHTIACDSTISLGYRLWIHRGHADTARSGDAWSAWMQELGRSTPTDARFDPLGTDGWFTVGTAHYVNEDGVLHGWGNEPRNSFHVFSRNLGDFELEMEFKPAPGSNSGVQVRSRVTDDGTAVRGYQIEIDTSERAWTGGLYDERRRGWLEPLDDQPIARSAFIHEQWNHLRVILEGAHIRSWINGVPCVDTYDATDLEGIIAFQVHGGSCDVRWRAIGLTPLGRHRWHPAFDRFSLSNWKMSGSGRWSVENGILVGRHTDDGSHAARLIMDRPLDDFTARIEFMISHGDAGVQFRTDHSGEGGSMAIISATPNRTGVLRHPGDPSAATDDARHDGDSEPTETDRWDTIMITAEGPRVVVHVNGRKTADVIEETLHPGGGFGLFLPEGQETELRVRSIEFLRPDPGTSTANGMPASAR